MEPLNNSRLVPHIISSGPLDITCDLQVHNTESAFEIVGHCRLPPLSCYLGEMRPGRSDPHHLELFLYVSLGREERGEDSLFV